MNATTIICPHCRKPFEISDAIQHQIEDELLRAKSEQSETLRKEYDVLAETKIKQAVQSAVDEAQQAAELQLARERQSARLELEKAKQTTEFETELLRSQAESSKESEKQLREQQKGLLEELSKANKAKEDAELAARKELLEKEKLIREEATTRASENFNTKIREQEETINKLREQLTTAKQVAEQGSQQLQGEILELDVEQNLRSNFPFDSIEEVKKGERGSDIRQMVNEQFYQDCGLILWECKNAKTYQTMSDFFDGYIQQLTCDLRNNSVVVELANIPAADIGLINDAVHQMDAVLDGTYSYLPDFDHLPRDIKTKLDKGIYKLGESRQVDGNLRPVILDENGVRVKDVTLKEVMNDHGTLETTRNVFNQLQMRQLFAKLDSIQELQSYQIDRDRDRDIVTPFLNARDNILRAQNQGSNETRYEYLSKAVNELTSAINAVYTDMETATSHLLKLTRWPIFQRFDQIKKYIEFLTRDIQLSAKFVGVQTQVLNYLGDSKSASLELERFRHVLQGFFSKPLNTRQISASMLIHQFFPYTDENRNSWVTLSKEIGSMLKSDMDFLENKKVILISAEEADNA